jgi:prostaglandin-E synthase 1
MRLLLLDDNVRTLVLVNVLLVFKLISSGNITSSLRLSRKVFANPEDYAARHVAPSTAADAQVERSRRAHQNDLENILPFMPLSMMYALTSPSHTLFASLSWAFLGARVLYTIAYFRGLQPWRSIAFGVGMLIMLAIGVSCLVALR